MGYSGYCKPCESEKAVRRITMPYAAKLLIQELGSMNVKVTIGLEDEFREIWTRRFFFLTGRISIYRVSNFGSIEFLISIGYEIID